MNTSLSIPKLAAGDKIAIVATGKKITQVEIQTAIDHFKSWGLEVVIGESIDKVDHYFSGKDEVRKNDLQKQINDPTIKAIIFARGGYGTVRIIDHLDLTPLYNTSKILLGFSDVTVLHNHFNKKGIKTIHGIMPVFFPTATSDSIESCKKALFDNKLHYEFEGAEWSKDGEASGKVIGGNLSVIYSLLGSASSISADNSILFIEDLCESYYHVDRMLQNLKRNNIFNGISGVIIGSFTDMNQGKPAFKGNLTDVFKPYFESLNIPVFMGFPSGHINNNHCLIFGSESHLIVKGDKITLTMTK